MVTVEVVRKNKWKCDREKFESSTKTIRQIVNKEIEQAYSDIRFARDCYFNRDMKHTLFLSTYNSNAMFKMMNDGEIRLELWKAVRQMVEDIYDYFYDKCNTELNGSNIFLINFPRIIDTSWRETMKKYLDTIEFIYQIDVVNYNCDNREVWYIKPIIHEVDERIIIRDKRKLV